MPFKKVVFLIALSYLTQFSFAQTNNSIQVSICIQHAETMQHVLGTSVTIKELDTYREIMNIEGMYSAVFIPTNFEANQKYRISVRKKGFYPLDTVFVAKAISTSNKLRLGLYLRPVICATITGNVVDASSLEKIDTGKIVFKNLQNNLSFEVEIQNGTYEFCGVSEQEYLIRTYINGHLDQSETIELKLNPSYKNNEQELRHDIHVSKHYEQDFFAGDSITLHNFTFVDESPNLSSKGELEINRLIQTMKQTPNMLLSIAIQAEEFIESRFNRKLAEQRARMIEHKLTVAGISPHRYLLICHGKVDASTPDACKSQRVCLWLRK